ncbi:glycoside hydrolase family 38 N-terminal domain-containing protein [Chitinophaga rhizosphaerae]|uniref:glycoside hydrolase family 38 N-terminal domain-containing protein n=1 Tax=Chitinophaga rhizosphaerae TaxID=1864947 RepID=UPI000F7FB0D5|nr:hypothetical protein [Chitinophaga rhizosphaerae]
MKKKLLSITCAMLCICQAIAQTKPTAAHVTDVWIVVKSHFDLGFTDLAENVFHRYRTEMMDNALKVIDQNRDLPASHRFVWTVPGWPLQAQMLGQQQDPARREKIEKAVKEGYIAVHALPFTTHTESQDLADLVHGLSIAANVSRQFNRPLPIAAKMTDVPSHSWVMPVLLHHAGVKFLHIGVNPASQYPRVPQLFWWEGPDGSRVLCGYTVDYGSSFLPPQDWPCRNYLSMIMAGDNHGPPSPEEVGKWRKEYEEKMPGVRVHFGTLDDFAKAVLSENPQVPVVKGDMPDTWIHGLMSMPQATKTARNLRPLEPALESLDTHLRAWGLTTGPLQDALNKAYENSLLYSEHTWGMNAEYGPRRLYGNAWKQWLADLEKEPLPENGDYAKLPRGSKRKWMQSYEDHRNYARSAAQTVTAELDKRMAQLAGAVPSKGKSIVVYNALPWRRSGMVTVDGNPVWVDDVPANGYKTVPNAQALAQKQKGNTRLETRYFVATFDLERGGIRSLVDKASGKEMIDTASGYVAGQFLHERFSSHEVYDRFFNQYSRIQTGWGLNDIGKPGMPDAADVPYKATTIIGWELAQERSPAEDRIVLTAAGGKGLAKGYAITFTFPRSRPYIDIEWQVKDKTPDKHPEGGWLCFPFNIRQPEFVVGRLGAPIHPATDIIPGTNRHLLAVTTGVEIRGAGVGAGVCPIDAPLVSLGEPGLWRWTMDGVPAKPYVFVNLYNNMWNTNFPLWQDGSWSERVRIWPVSGNGQPAANLAVQSWEARLPLLAAVAGNQQGTLPATKEGLHLSRKGTLVTAFGPGANGREGTLLTVWEQAGLSGMITVRLPEGKTWRKAVPVDLRGEKLSREAIPVKARQFSFSLNKYAPASFILE